MTELKVLQKLKPSLPLKIIITTFFHIQHAVLLNPCKSELGKISKCILEEVNNTVKTTLNFNQWKNTNEVVDWFINIYNKHQCTFIQLDIKDVYPSITEEILEKSLEFAKQYVDITEKNTQLIKHCRKSLLFLNDEPWKKKNTGVVLT